MIGLVTEQGRAECQAANELAATLAKARMGAGPMTPEDGESQPHDDGRESLKRMMPDAATMMEPHHMDAGDYQRGRLEDGRAAYSHQASPANKISLPGLTVDGDGPIAEQARRGGGQ